MQNNSNIEFFFNFNFNSNEYKFLFYFYGCRNNIAILDKFDATGACFFSLKKHAFVDRVFNFNVSLWKDFSRFLLYDFNSRSNAVKITIL